MSVPSTPHRPKVVLLCGGLGTRMREETEYRPKPMVEVGGKPLLWHIMKTYGAHGLTDFVCCLGYRGQVIKQYFLDYHAMRSDISIGLASGTVEYANREVEEWNISLVDTGEHSMTGARVKRVEPWLGESDIFLCTYGDGVADIDVDEVSSFAEKPAGDGLISGGFFVFDRAVLDRLSADPSCILEREPLEGLAADGELAVYRHDGFWQCADTVRDVEILREMWERGDAPWRTWDDRVADADAHPGRRAGDHVEALLRAVTT